MKLFKFIKSQNGFSLVEVMVATGMAIALSVGVMKVNQTAQQGVASSNASRSLQELEATLKRKLSTPDIANNALYDGTNRFGDGSLDASSNITSAITMVHTGYSSSPELEEGEIVSSSPEWKVTSISMMAFNNGGSASLTGFCNLEVLLEKVAKTKNKIGGNERRLLIPMTCIVNNTTDNDVVDLSATGEEGEDELYWKRVESSPTYLFLEHNGIGSTAQVKIGSGSAVANASVLGALVLDPASDGSQNDPQTSAAFMALQLPNMATITFGDASSAANSTNLYYNSSTSNTLDSDGSFQAAGNIGGASVSGTSAAFGTVSANEMNVQSGAGAIYVNNLGSSANRVNQIWANNVNGSTTTPSDERLKKDINDISSASDVLSNIRPVTYYMRDEEFPEYNFDKKLHYGVIAQEVAKVIPELAVKLNGATHFSVNYTEFIPLLIKGHQEQKVQIQDNFEKFILMQNGISRKIASVEAKLEKRIDQLEVENNELKAELNEIRAMLLEIQKNQ